MEFPFDVGDVLPGRVTVIEVKNSFSSIEISSVSTNSNGDIEVIKGWTYIQSCNAPWDLKVKRKRENLEIIIDTLGAASAKAQNLNLSITTLKKIISSNNQKIYVMRDIHEPRSVIGMLKVGVKSLFITDEEGAQQEVDPLCILDFYINESKQRSGFGHELFDIMLKVERVHPVNLAIDRPSSKCIAFLKKHYNLGQHLLQPNNFIIYPGFLSGIQSKRPRIFLYKGKVSSRSDPNSLKHRSYQSKTQRDALNSVPVLVKDKDVKSKTFYSTVGNSLQWNNSDDKSTCYSKSSLRESDAQKNRKNWGLHRESHSNASSSSKTSDGWNSMTTKCSLTPVDNISSRQRKWNYEMNSSWNIFGVKPVEYTYQKVSK